MQFRRPCLSFFNLLRREILFDGGNQFAECFSVSICFCQENPSVGLNIILPYAAAEEILRAQSRVS